jgi:hypothetical protein
MLAAEYTSLREEIIKRIEIQHQLLSLALIAPGTVLAIGFQTRSASLLFVYPLLGMFLAAVWLANSLAIHDIAGYIRSQIQPRVGEGRAIWERHRASIDTSRVRLLHFWGTRGIFIGTELLALVAGVTLATFNTAQILFLSIGIICSVSTTLLLSLPQVNRLDT